MDKNSNILAFLGAEIARQLEGVPSHNFASVTEIRLRVDKPMIIRMSGRDHFVTRDGLSPVGAVHAFCPGAECIRETMERISQYSFYAFEAELSHGYITLPGGHRVGVCGQVVIENGSVKAWRYITGLNIRVAHSVLGCAANVLPFIYNGETLLNTMVISPPGFGKTTLLRDIVRQVSNGFEGRGLTVGLADERSEVAGCFRGVAQNDVGFRTDVIDGCPKAQAMLMLLRAMSPDVIAVDELGGEGDARAVDTVLNAGVSLLCTAHGKDVPDVKAGATLSGLLKRDVFQRFIVLKQLGEVEGVYDGGGNRVS